LAGILPSGKSSQICREFYTRRKFEWLKIKQAAHAACFYDEAKTHSMLKRFARAATCFGRHQRAVVIFRLRGGIP